MNLLFRVVSRTFLAGMFLWAVTVKSQETEAPGEDQGTAETRLQVRTTPPGAQVWVDGRQTEHRTPLEVELEPGRHELRLVLENYREEAREVELRPGKTTVVRLLLRPEREFAAEDRRTAFQGGYFQAGGARLQLHTTDIKLSLDSEYEVPLKNKVHQADGISLQLRYLHPLGHRGFLITDASYSDARIRLSNLYLVGSKGGVKDDYDLFLVRGGLDLSFGLNALDFLLPYAGAGLNYTVLYDADKAGLIGSDYQEDFMGYTVKTGVLFTSRSHLIFTLEYQYHWAYEWEDYTLLAFLGWQF